MRISLIASSEAQPFCAFDQGVKKDKNHQREGEKDEVLHDDALIVE